MRRPTVQTMWKLYNTVADNISQAPPGELLVFTRNPWRYALILADALEEWGFDKLGRQLTRVAKRERKFDLFVRGKIKLPWLKTPNQNVTFGTLNRVYRTLKRLERTTS